MKSQTQNNWKEKLDDWIFDHIPGPIYRIPTRIKDFFHNVEYAFQLVFRKNHIPDRQIWNLYPYMAEYLYPRIKAFKESKRMGYPADFSEYNENEWENKENYDLAIEYGKMIGGGEKAWEEVLDKILFAFEYLKAEEDEKFQKKVFAIKYGDIHEEIKSNLCEHTWYKNKSNDTSMLVDKNDPINLDEWEKEEHDLFSNSFYYNIKLHTEFSKKAEEGFKLFGKYFMSFWDWKKNNE